MKNAFLALLYPGFVLSKWLRTRRAFNLLTWSPRIHFGLTVYAIFFKYQIRAIRTGLTLLPSKATHFRWHVHRVVWVKSFDLNHWFKSLQKIIDLWFFWLPVFLIADLYEFNTNNCLRASRSTKFCVFFNTKAQSAHTCVAVLTPDSLIVK